MATKGKRPMRALTPGDKIEAIQRVNDGESKASVARDIGVPESTLRGWCKNEDKLRYMTSRLSSPDTEKSSDGEPPVKRAHTESPTAPESTNNTGLDLSNSIAVANSTALLTPPIDAPVELTTKRSEPSPPLNPPRQRRPDPGVSVSMSASSPLSALGHLPGLAHSHLGLSFNEIANNLTLIAHFNPRLSTLSAQQASRALRSVRSPKPAHNGVLNLNDTKHRNKSNHSSDPHRQGGSKSTHHLTSQSANQPVNDTLWYWLKTQQAMLDLTAQTSAHRLQLGQNSDSTMPPNPVAPALPMSSHLDYNRNAWLWPYKDVGGAMPVPEDKHRSAPKEKSGDILFSQLTKVKAGDERGVISPDQNQTLTAKVRETIPAPVEAAASPDVGTENKEPSIQKHAKSRRSQNRARTVLDNLLYNSGSRAANEENKSNGSAKGEWEPGTLEALEHGDKFLAWLETSGDPSVTRMHLNQLRGLLHNLRTRRAAAPAAASRRK